MASESEKKNTVEITIYAMPGSQFTGKVLAALDARKIPHYSLFVPMQLEPRKKVIPSGGTLVPEMKVNLNGGEPSIVPDSEAILHWLDDHNNLFENTAKFFPDDQASELSVRASDKILAGAVYYFNWVDPEGYARSMQKSMVKALFDLPAFFPEVIGNTLVNLFLGSTKKKFRQLAMEALSVEESALTDRDRIREILVEELKYFQSFLKTDDQPYLLGNASTAPDFSVYAQVERLVGDMGDAKIPCSIPELKGNTPELARLWKWHEHMRENHPLKFKGKRPPKKD